MPIVVKKFTLQNKRSSDFLWLENHFEFPMIRKSLFLILTLALLSVPIFSMAHAFTHFAQADVLDVTETGTDNGADLDEICLDCLALTALNIFLVASGLALCGPIARHHLSLLTIRHHSDNKTLSYHSRAPPVSFHLIY